MSIGLFFTYTQPEYQGLQGLRAESDELAEALNNATKLEKERDVLAEVYTTFSEADIERLERMVPDQADIIELVLEVYSIGIQTGVTVKNVDFDPNEIKEDEAVEGEIIPRRSVIDDSNPLVDIYSLSFSVEAEYANYVDFLSLIERSLRILDISNITFASSDAFNEDGSYNDSYDFQFSVKAYRLK